MAVALPSTKPRVAALVTGHRGPILDLAVASDGNRFVSLGRDKTLRYWDRTGKALKSVSLGAEGERCSMAVADGGVLCQVTGEVRLYDWNGNVKVRVKTAGSPAYSGDLSVVALYAGGLEVVSGGKSVGSVKRVGTENTTIHALALSPDRKKVVLVGSSYNPASPSLPDDSVAYEYDVARQKMGPIEITGQFGSKFAAYAPDGRRAIGGNSHPDSQTSGWMQLQPKVAGIPENWDDHIGDLSFSPDSSWMIVCEKETSLWDLMKGSKICSLGMGFPVAAAGKDFFVTGDVGGQIQIWDWTP